MSNIKQKRIRTRHNHIVDRCSVLLSTFGEREAKLRKRIRQLQKALKPFANRWFESVKFSIGHPTEDEFRAAWLAYSIKNKKINEDDKPATDKK